MTRAYHKPFLSFAKQVELLKKRGLSIADEPAAAAFFSHGNYYRFSGYTHPFQLESNSLKEEEHQFRPGTTFEDVRCITLINSFGN